MFKKEIEDEEKGEEHYEKLAKKMPKHKKMLMGIAKQESSHEDKLKSAKTKALKKACR